MWWSLYITPYEELILYFIALNGFCDWLDWVDVTSSIKYYQSKQWDISLDLLWHILNCKMLED